MSAMSQGSKVLHLYVEVRSVSEDEDRLTGGGDEDRLPLQFPDVLSSSGRSSSFSSAHRSLPPSPLLQQRSGPHSLSSSRHSVSFQLQGPDTTGSPTQYMRQKVPSDGFAQLLDVLTPRRRNSSLDVRAPSSPSSTSTGRRSSVRNQWERLGLEEGEEGKTSVVSFGYIKKSNVHGMFGRRADSERALCKSADFQDRPRDSLWNHPHCSPQSPRGPPHLQRFSTEVLARDDASRAVQDLVSPELSHMFMENCSPSLPSARCQSWGGSPVLPRSAQTLPTQPLQLDRQLWSESANGFPRSPNSERLCVSTGLSPHSTGTQACSLSHPRAGSGSPRSPGQFQPPLPAGRHTDIHHHVSGRMLPTRSCIVSCPTSCSPPAGSTPPLLHTMGDTACTHRASTRTLGTDGPTPSPTGSAPLTALHNHSSLELLQDERACPPASPALPARLHRTGASRFPLLDPRQCSSSRDTTLHRYQILEYTREQQLDEQRSVTDNGSTLSGRTTRDGPQRTCAEPNIRVSRLRQDTVIYPQSFAVQPVAYREMSVCEHHKEQGHTSSAHSTAARTTQEQTHRSQHSQRIAQAKWEFLFGPQTDQEAPPPEASHGPLNPANERKTLVTQQEVRKVQVEQLNQSKGSVPKTHLIRTIKYTETDLDCEPAPPTSCYRETDLDQVMRAEAEDGVQRSQPSESLNLLQEEEQEERVGVVSVKMEGDKPSQTDDDAVPQQFRNLEVCPDADGGLKSPISVGSPLRTSDSNMDTFSRHFENIMESHRAKGTSYSSLDSVELLSSGSAPVFTFDLPTLTPQIQSQICASAKQILELSFAPLVRPDPYNTPTSSAQTSRSTLALCSQGVELGKDSAPLVRIKSRPLHRDRKASSVPSLYCSSREHPTLRPSELSQPQPGVSERSVLGDSEEALANGTKADLQAAKRLATRLYSLDGFRKSDISRHLGKNNEFSHMVAEEYLSNFNFSGMTIDQALRSFLTQLALMGETQERERVLVHFSRRFRHCNPHYLQTEDSVHTLTCAVMLLNTDLHGNSLKKRMSCTQFVSNLEGLNDGKDYPKDLLKALYNSIKSNKLQWIVDDDEEELQQMLQKQQPCTDWSSRTMRRPLKGNPLVCVGEQGDAHVYMSGFLVRKVHADPDGKRTPRGKRGWKSFYGVLRGLMLYLQKDAECAERPLLDEDVRRSVSVHHSLAMKAADYSKRTNVFYLRTADWRVFLLQAPNAEQMQSWITRINLVAATFSAPPFPAAIGSQRSFSRPLLPASHSKLSEEEQLKAHQSRFRSISSELSQLDEDKKFKGPDPEDLRVRKEYLEFERTRYGTYSLLLRAKLQSGESDLCRFQSLLNEDVLLHRTHSTPSLQEHTRRTASSRSLRGMPSKGAGPRCDDSRDSKNKVMW